MVMFHTQGSSFRVDRCLFAGLIIFVFVFVIILMDHCYDLDALCMAVLLESLVLKHYDQTLEIYVMSIILSDHQLELTR